MRLIRFLSVLGILVWHILSGWVARYFFRNPVLLRRHFLKKVSLHAKWVQKGLRITPVVEGAENIRTGQNYLIVANHLSYVDAILISGFKEVAYVTSIEMKHAPFLGAITQMGGCLYVERRSKENIHNEISEIEEALRQGFDVMIFPEATSTDGTEVRQFKRPLFAAAVKARIPVLPLVIQYDSLDGKPVTAKNRDHLCWYGDMGFASHFFGLTAFREIKLRLKFLPEIPVTDSSTRDTLMEAAYQRIKEAYEPIR